MANFIGDADGLVTRPPMRGPGLPEDWARDEAVMDWWRGVIAC